MKTTLVTMFLGALLFTMSLATVYAENAAYIPDEVLIKLKDGTDPDAIQAIKARLGAEIVHKFRIIENSYHLRLRRGMSVPNAIAICNRYPAVECVEPNYILYADDIIPDDPSFPKLWGMNNIGQTGGTPDADIDAPEAWQIGTGSEEIVVASIDTGVDYNHEDLADNIWVNPGEIPDNGVDDDGNGYVDDIHGYDFVNNDGDPMDDHGHGTHTSGTIGAVGNNATGVTGVCWDVRIMALKFLDAGGSGSTADAIKCILYATMMGADLTNNSWGGGGKSTLLAIVIWKGPLFVAAAGNNGQNTDISPHYPSSYRLPNIISVAATDHNDMKAGFSNYGANSVDLGAPGVNILSTLPGDSYGPAQGTSMAAPHVSGVAALILSVNPGLSDLDVKDAILSSVDPVPDLAGKVLTDGRLNAANALMSVIPAAPPIAIANSRELSHFNPIMASSLGNAYPSPANPEVWIPYRLNEASNVTISIYNMSGRVVRTLEIGHQPAGIYESKQLAAHWDGCGADGEFVASGIYFYTLKAGDYTATRKMFIVR